MRWRVLSLNQMGPILATRPCIKKKKTILFRFFFLIKKKNLDKTYLFVLQPSSLNLSLCLSISPPPPNTSCVLMCITVALLSTQNAFRGLLFFFVRMSTFLAQANVFKILPRGNTWPFSVLSSKKKKRRHKSVYTVFLFMAKCDEN